MERKFLVKTALKRQEVFRDLEKHLQTIKETLSKLDTQTEVYLFGSVAENRQTYSSDIDVLVVTKLEPARVHYALWNSGIKEPFEIHVQPPEKIDFYRRRAKLTKI
jgi:predicted nucleotidyltransferase